MPNVEQTLTKIVGNVEQITAIFDPSVSGGKVSSNVYCGGNTFIGILIPTAFVAGNLSFYGSLTAQPSTFYQLTDVTGTLLTVPTNATGSIITPTNPALGTVGGILIPLDPAVFCAIQNLIIYCSNAQTAVQNLQLVMAPVLGS